MKEAEAPWKTRTVRGFTAFRDAKAGSRKTSHGGGRWNGKTRETQSDDVQKIRNLDRVFPGVSINFQRKSWDWSGSLGYSSNGELWFRVTISCPYARAFSELSKNPTISSQGPEKKIIPVAWLARFALFFSRCLRCSLFRLQVKSR